jgi:hypothetical protein
MPAYQRPALWVYTAPQLIAKRIYKRYIYQGVALAIVPGFVILSKAQITGAQFISDFVQVMHTNLILASETLAVVNWNQRSFAQGRWTPLFLWLSVYGRMIYWAAWAGSQLHRGGP